MTIKYEKNKMFVECDDCGETMKALNGRDTQHYDREDFDILLEDLKDNGWAFKRLDSGKYEHTCDDCQ